MVVEAVNGSGEEGNAVTCSLRRQARQSLAEDKNSRRDTDNCLDIPLTSCARDTDR